MASVAAETVRPAPVVAHRPWWRGKLVQVAGIVALMYVAYRVWALEYPWPVSLEWNALSGHLDDFQTWLIDERNVEEPSVVFAAFDAFATFLDNLVDWFERLLLWLTWVGTTVAGTLLALRFGGWRAAAWTVAAFATFALVGLWEESMQTLALMLAAVGLSLLVGIPLGILSRALEPVLTGDHACSRRDADRACVRVSDPGRGPVLGGCRRGGRVDDDLRDPAGRPHHRARDPWRGREHGRGRHVAGRDPRSDAVARCSFRCRGGRSCSASTRPSCSPSPWSSSPASSEAAGSATSSPAG